MFVIQCWLRLHCVSSCPMLIWSLILKVFKVWLAVLIKSMNPFRQWRCFWQLKSWRFSFTRRVVPFNHRNQNQGIFLLHLTKTLSRCSWPGLHIMINYFFFWKTNLKTYHADHSVIYDETYIRFILCCLNVVIQADHLRNRRKTLKGVLCTYSHSELNSVAN